MESVNKNLPILKEIQGSNFLKSFSVFKRVLVADESFSKLVNYLENACTVLQKMLSFYFSAEYS